MIKKRMFWTASVWAGFLFAAVIIFAQQANVVHTVIEGDTLWDLSGKYLQNPFSWPLIWEANQDKIADPHWIYPGQVLGIPPAAGQVAGPDTATIAQAEPQSGVATELEIVEERPAVVATSSKHIVNATKPLPVVSEKLAFQAGFIEENNSKPSGHLIGTDRDKIIENLSTNDFVYINLGTQDGVKAGDKYAFYREGKIVKHPKTGKILGKWINIVGVVEVVDMVAKTSRGRIVACYDPIARNEAIRPYVEIIVPKNVSPLPVQKSNEGYIVNVVTPSVFATSHNIVFIDKGLADGTMPGDVFEVYRSGINAADPDRGGSNVLPDRTIAQLQVLSVRNNTAAAVLIRSATDDLVVGDKIRMIKQVPSR